jgi:hypothetical protein
MLKSGKVIRAKTCLTLIILVFSIMFFSSTGSGSSSGTSDSSFSIMQITDTQFLSESNPGLFDNMTSWIASNAANYNLQMVIHTGDIVDIPEKSYQWVNANKSLSTLINAKIPYCWTVGNHDLTDPGSSWNGAQYLAFQGLNMKSNSYWVDDCYNSKNTAVQFSVNNYPFLIIDLEYHANSSAIAWMKDLLSKSSGSNVIVATHSYLNSTNGYGYGGDYVWETNLRNLLDGYTNVFLTLSGHDNLSAGGNYTRIGNREEVFFNRQSIDDFKGSAAVRIYTFNLNTMQASVSTWYCLTQTWLTEPFNQFTFKVNLQKDDYINVFPYSYYWVNPSYQNRISFSKSCSVDSATPVASGWFFKNLQINGVKSNLSMITSGASVVINSCDPSKSLNYTVIGNGTQTISVNKTPASVSAISSKPGVGYNYTNGVITVTNSSSSSNVLIVFGESNAAPSASNLALDSTTAGDMATFSAFWNDSNGLTDGGYIFGTNNTGQWVNASWVSFDSTPDFGDGALVLNNTVGAVVGFQEFANNSLGNWGASDVYAIKTTEPNCSPTPTSTPSITPTSTGEVGATPNSVKTESFSNDIILMAATAVTVSIAVFSCIFKKGYLKPK